MKYMNTLGVLSESNYPCLSISDRKIYRSINPILKQSWGITNKHNFSQHGGGLEEKSISETSGNIVPVSNVPVSNANTFLLIANTLKLLYDVGSSAVQYYGSEQATQAKNILSKVFDKNPNARPGYSGEFHMVLPTDYGLSMANYQ